MDTVLLPLPPARHILVGTPQVNIILFFYPLRSLRQDRLLTFDPFVEKMVKESKLETARRPVYCVVIDQHLSQPHQVLGT